MSAGIGIGIPASIGTRSASAAGTPSPVETAAIGRIVKHSETGPWTDYRTDSVQPPSGGMLALNRKKLVGSYLALSATSRFHCSAL